MQIQASGRRANKLAKCRVESPWFQPDDSRGLKSCSSKVYGDLRRGSFLGCRELHKSEQRIYHTSQWSTRGILSHIMAWTWRHRTRRWQCARVCCRPPPTDFERRLHQPRRGGIWITQDLDHTGFGSHKPGCGEHGWQKQPTKSEIAYRRCALLAHADWPLHSLPSSTPWKRLVRLGSGSARSLLENHAGNGTRLWLSAPCHRLMDERKPAVIKCD